MGQNRSSAAYEIPLPPTIHHETPHFQPAVPKDNDGSRRRRFVLSSPFFFGFILISIYFILFYVLSGLLKQEPTTPSLPGRFIKRTSSRPCWNGRMLSIKFTLTLIKARPISSLIWRWRLSQWPRRELGKKKRKGSCRRLRREGPSWRRTRPS